MLSYLVQANQRKDVTASGVSVDQGRNSRQTDSRDFATLFKKQEDATDFTGQEKEVVLPKVEEVDEAESLASSESQLIKPEDEERKQERLEQLQMELIDAQSKLFRLQAQYNNELASSQVFAVGVNSQQQQVLT